MRRRRRCWLRAASGGETPELTPSGAPSYFGKTFTSSSEGESVVVTAHRGAGGRGERPWAERQALYGGFGEALSQAFEFAVTPILFAALGWWIDGRLGTS